MFYKLFSLCSLLGSLWCFFHEMLPVPVSPDELLIAVHRNGKAGFINAKGRVVLPIKWDEAHDFHSYGMAAVRLDDQSGWIDRSGKLIVKGKWNYFRDFDREGMACVKMESKVGWIDLTGKVVIEPHWDYAYDFDSSGMARVRLKGKYGWIDRMGKLVIPLQWDDAYDFDSGGLARVQNDKKWGWIDRMGKTVIPLQWDWTFDFDSGGLANVEKNNKWGWIGRDGHVAIPIEWVSARDFGEKGTAYVEKDGQSYVIDRSGKAVKQKDTDREVSTVGEKSAGPVRSLSDSEGEWCDENNIFRYKYDDFDVNGLTIAERFDMRLGINQQCFGVYGCLDQTGKEVIAAQWFRIHSPQMGKQCVYMAYKYIPDKPNVIWAWIRTRLSFLFHAPSPTNPNELCVCFDSKGREIWRSDWQERDRLWGTLLGVVAVGTFFWGRRRRR